MSDIRQTTIEHLKVAHAALDKSKAEMDKVAAQRAAVEALIPEAVEALVKHERIGPDSREKAAAKLRDPVEMLRILIHTADPEVNIRPKPMGKAGSAGGGGGDGPGNNNPNYAGEVYPRGERESDRAYKAALLGPR